MNFTELAVLAIGLSMDAFAAAVCVGLTMTGPDIKKSFIIGLYFGVFQAVMPLLGYMAGKQFAHRIAALDHWIAFALLCLIGGKMIADGLKKEGCPDRECPVETCGDRTCPDGKRPDKKEFSSSPAQMLPLALATSIDALAVGVSFAFLRVGIVPAVSFIGLTTLAISMWGVKIGRTFGESHRSKAELAGGAILVLIGLKILLEL